MRNMRHQKANSQETKTFSDEEKETDTERSYVFVYQTPDGRTCQTEAKAKTKEKTGFHLELWDVFLAFVVVGRFLGHLGNMYKKWI